MSGAVRVIGLDGHDGSGKTTLARSLAAHLAAEYARPFAGATGAALMRAGEAGDLRETIAIGQEAMARVLARANPARPLVLDRSWLTVASFCPWDEFASHWSHWVPTILCWADVPTTLERLAQRGDRDRFRPVAWHRQYLARYEALAKAAGVPIVRTDDVSVDEALIRLVQALPAGGEMAPDPSHRMPLGPTTRHR